MAVQHDGKVKDNVNCNKDEVHLQTLLFSPLKVKIDKFQDRTKNIMSLCNATGIYLI